MFVRPSAAASPIAAASILVATEDLPCFLLFLLPCFVACLRVTAACAAARLEIFQARRRLPASQQRMRHGGLPPTKSWFLYCSAKISQRWAQRQRRAPAAEAGWLVA